MAKPPRSEVAVGGFLCPRATHSALFQLGPSPSHVLPLSPQHRPQPAPYPRIKRRSAELFFSEKNYSAVRQGELDTR
jgi:hypothetical protein